MKHLVAAALAEHGEIDLGHRVGGQHFQLCTLGKVVHGLARSPDRLGTGQAAAVDHPYVRIVPAHV